MVLSDVLTFYFANYKIQHGPAINLFGKMYRRLCFRIVRILTKRMKRSGGDRFGSGSKRTRMDSYEEALASGKYELRLVVTSRGAGGIIGRGGENIKRLRSEVLSFG